jgi:exosortase B
MSTVLQERTLAHAEAGSWRPWIALLAGLAALYVPTYIDLAQGLWRDDEHAHGPIIVAVFAWLVWRSRGVLLDESLEPAPLAGGLALVLGLALYLLGRTQSLPLFEVASHIPVIAGAVLLLRGFAGLKALAFPILFLAFLVPLPGFVLDILTGPLKEFVSAAVAPVLTLLGYPVEREGVVLWVGDYQMLVADACSGLNSLYSLLALGLLYTHVTPPRRVSRTVLMLAAMVPIAVVANICRVLLLVLVTYHLGPEVAQGWVHDFAGMMVFVIALLLMLGADKVLRRVVPAKAGTQDDWAPVHRRVAAPGATTAAIVATIAMIGTAAAAPVLKPVPGNAPAPDLQAIIPSQFGDWKLDPDTVPVTAAPDVQANLDRLYDQIVARTYVNSAGEQMMLTVAYGGDQSDALKAHRQEVCYRAQGFDIASLAHGRLAASGREIPVTRFHARLGERSEPVTYWFTMGDRVVLGRGERLRVQLEHGFAGRIPDGMLVRVSSLSTEPAAAYAAQASFIAAIAAALPSHDSARFIGAPRS